MVTIFKDFFNPIYYAFTRNEPRQDYYNAYHSDRKPNFELLQGIDSKSELIASLVGATVAAGEFFALRMLMAQMPNTLTAIVTGGLFYRAMGGIAGYASSDLAMAAWLTGEVIKSLTHQKISLSLAGIGIIKIGAAVGFFFHQFAIIDEIQLSLIDKFRVFIQVPPFRGTDQTWVDALKFTRRP